ncbi:MAG: hypothetical protein KDA57_18535 [Planctomycetales bacterium]|nr:hypothetical protein [Planctomycetales bacterium]
MQAYSFGRAAKLVYESLLSEVPSDPAGIAPFVVNGSFGIEIYLKTLNLIGRAAYNGGHDVLAQYDRLPEQMKSRLEEIRARYFSEKGLPEQGSMHDMLRRIGNAFEVWRYQHEKGEAPMVDVIDVFSCLDILHRACLAGGNG